MKLTQEQKQAVLEARNRPGCEKVELVRVGESWSCVWQEPDARPADRWRGQLVKTVAVDKDLLELVGTTSYDVWWTGGELCGRTRREVIAQLQAEELIK